MFRSMFGSTLVVSACTAVAVGSVDAGDAFDPTFPSPVDEPFPADYAPLRFFGYPEPFAKLGEGWDYFAREARPDCGSAREASWWPIYDTVSNVAEHHDAYLTDRASFDLWLASIDWQLPPEVRDAARRLADRALGTNAITYFEVMAVRFGQSSPPDGEDDATAPDLAAWIARCGHQRLGAADVGVWFALATPMAVPSPNVSSSEVEAVGIELQGLPVIDLSGRLSRASRWMQQLALWLDEHPEYRRELRSIGAGYDTPSTTQLEGLVPEPGVSAGALRCALGLVVPSTRESALIRAASMERELRRASTSTERRAAIRAGLESIRACLEVELPAIEETCRHAVAEAPLRACDACAIPTHCSGGAMLNRLRAE